MPLSPNVRSPRALLVLTFRAFLLSARWVIQPLEDHGNDWVTIVHERVPQPTPSAAQPSLEPLAGSKLPSITSPRWGRPVAFLPLRFTSAICQLRSLRALLRHQLAVDRRRLCRFGPFPRRSGSWPPLSQWWCRKSYDWNNLMQQRGSFGITPGASRPWRSWALFHPHGR